MNVCANKPFSEISCFYNHIFLVLVLEVNVKIFLSIDGSWLRVVQTSLHGSCAVIKGEKWVATKWIRDQEQDEES